LSLQIFAIWVIQLYSIKFYWTVYYLEK
jgi:hypothetical protein